MRSWCLCLLWFVTACYGWSSYLLGWWSGRAVRLFWADWFCSEVRSASDVLGVLAWRCFPAVLLIVWWFGFLVAAAWLLWWLLGRVCAWCWGWR